MFCSDIFSSVAARNPLVHCITNYVTANDCANVLLACGASPVMADEPAESGEVTSRSSALVLNFGTFGKDRLESMIISGKTANSLNLPVVLDPVGVGISPVRREAFERLAGEVNFSVVRGNASEIMCLAGNIDSSLGVDVGSGISFSGDNVSGGLHFARKLAAKLGCSVVMTGEWDIVTDGIRSCFVKNGAHEMSRVTGCGCMLSSLIGAFCGAWNGNAFECAVSAAVTFGICGEEAHNFVSARSAGTGSFRVSLLDAVSLMTAEKIERGANIEFFS